MKLQYVLFKKKKKKTDCQPNGKQFYQKNEEKIYSIKQQTLNYS